MIFSAAAPAASAGRRAQRVARRPIEVEHQAAARRSAPIPRRCGELAQQLDIDRQQRVQQRQRVEAGVLALAQLRKVTGPSSTGRVSMPSALASWYSSTGLREDSANVWSCVNSGTM